MLVVCMLLLMSIAATVIFWLIAANAISDAVSLTGLSLGIVTCVVAVVFAAMLIILPSSRAIGRHTCSNWSSETGIQTKFVLLNWSDTGTCLAKTPDGHWVKNSNWYAYVGVSK